MKIQEITVRGNKIAAVDSEEAIITDVQSALDFMATIRYETGPSFVVINKEALCAPFFILSSGLAGEILQKFINYGVKMAVYGDYSRYTSKPLRDFIYESNQGKDFFFVANEEEAIQKISQAM